MVFTGELKIITDSRILSFIRDLNIDLPVDFNSCLEEIPDALQEFCNPLYKRKHVESYALNSWKLNIFKMIDGKILFYCNYLDPLTRTPKFTFRNLKKGIQEIHRRYVLAPTDKAANSNVAFEKVLY